MLRWIYNQCAISQKALDEPVIVVQIRTYVNHLYGHILTCWKRSSGLVWS